MNILIEIYIFICVMLLIFNIGFLVMKNIKNHKLYPKDSKMGIKIRQELKDLKETGILSKSMEDILTNKISQTDGLIALQNELTNETEIKIRPYIFMQIDTYMDKSDYEQAYYTYVVSTLDYTQVKVDTEFARKFMKFLDSESLYTFTNAMEAVYSFGEGHLLINAIDNLDQRPGFYHKKLFVDGLLGFKGDIKEFEKNVINKFEGYSKSTQESLLDYFRIQGEDISELCLGLIEKGEGDVLYAAMRYFVKYPSESSKVIFLNILENSDNWIEQMLAIQGLKSFNDPKTKNTIKNKVNSRNWHVRTNAISYLYDLNISQDEIYDILFIRDRYANEALLYQYKDDKNMSKYITNTIQLLNLDKSNNDEFNLEMA